MPIKTKQSPLAVAYAKSLLELANQRGHAEPINAELQAIREAIESDPRFGFFLANPGIGSAEKLEVLRRVLEGKASNLLLNYIGVMASKDQLRLLPRSAQAYDDLLDEQLGKIEVDVTVAQRLTPDQLDQVRQQVSKALKKDAVVHQYVDESIIGGLILRVRDQLIDGSVKYQLESLRNRMLEARPK